ncbi:hypothetical protein B0J11DRAFT_538636 [Dendryphion nanum]|uniref:Uncharacterized protein n=1 Tax=Dendryphion nanum TaxID=256645 RepID=A0A9P9DAV4_9PLEO|nr:hypothetical protein B0J11DRAFT_538636 [Dendryphion nanum]
MRLALLNYTKPTIVNREFSDLPWCLPSATLRQLHLAPAGNIYDVRFNGSGTLSYQPDSNNASDKLMFTYRLPSKMAILRTERDPESILASYIAKAIGEDTEGHAA